MVSLIDILSYFIDMLGFELIYISEICDFYGVSKSHVFDIPSLSIEIASITTNIPSISDDIQVIKSKPSISIK